MRYIVTVFGEHSDPVARATFRSLKAANKFAAEWEGRTYELRHNLSQPAIYHWSGKLLSYPREPYFVSVMSAA